MLLCTGLGTSGASHQCHWPLLHPSQLHLPQVAKNIQDWLKVISEQRRVCVRGVCLKTEADESRSKCKETELYLFTLFDWKLCKSCTFWLLKPRTCFLLCKSKPPVRKKHSVLYCKPEQGIHLHRSLSGLALLSPGSSKVVALSLYSLKQSMHWPLRTGGHCSKDLVCFILAFPQSSFTYNSFFFFNLKLLFCVLLVTSILLHSKSRKQFK